VRDAFLYKGTDPYVMTQTWLYNLKEALTGTAGTWEVLASSAYVGGSTWTADTEDLWTDAESEVVWGSTGNDHAWIVLKSPSVGLGPYYLTLDYTQASFNYRGSIYLSKTQPTLTGLSTTARPANTGDEWGHVDITFNTANRNLRCNMLLAHDGSFAWLSQGDNDATFRGALIFNLMVRDSLRSDDTVGAVSLHWSSRGVKLTGGAVIQFQGLHPADGSQVDMRPVSLAWGSAFSRTEATLDTDFADGSWAAIPTYLWSETGGKMAFRGLLEDIFWAPEYLTETTQASSGDIPQAIKIGPFWMPAQETILLF
jgi:hypothetical protein